VFYIYVRLKGELREEKGGERGEVTECTRRKGEKKLMLCLAEDKGKKPRNEEKRGRVVIALNHDEKGGEKREGFNPLAMTKGGGPTSGEKRQQNKSIGLIEKGGGRGRRSRA